MFDYLLIFTGYPKWPRYVYTLYLNHISVWTITKCLDRQRSVIVYRSVREVGYFFLMKDSIISSKQQQTIPSIDKKLFQNYYVHFRLVYVAILQHVQSPDILLINSLTILHDFVFFFYRNFSSLSATATAKAITGLQSFMVAQ